MACGSRTGAGTRERLGLDHRLTPTQHRVLLHHPGHVGVGVHAEITGALGWGQARRMGYQAGAPSPQFSGVEPGPPASVYGSGRWCGSLGPGVGTESLCACDRSPASQVLGVPRRRAGRTMLGYLVIPGSQFLSFPPPPGAPSCCCSSSETKFQTSPPALTCSQPSRVSAQA